jgi:isopentenyl-diphosphate Delta-isomerase
VTVPPERVVTLDADARPVGTMDKLAAHGAPGHRHLAFSVLLRDRSGRVLLQRRADSKHHFAGAWANSCCSHPRPGEDLGVAVARRVREELGVESVGLEPHAAFWYRAEDPNSSLTEHEYDIVVRGILEDPAALDPDPAQISDLRWMDAATAVDGLRAEGALVAPWLPLVLSADAGPPGHVPSWLGWRAPPSAG